MESSERNLMNSLNYIYVFMPKTRGRIAQHFKKRGIFKVEGEPLICSDLKLILHVCYHWNKRENLLSFWSLMSIELLKKKTYYIVSRTVNLLIIHYLYGHTNLRKNLHWKFSNWHGQLFPVWVWFDWTLWVLVSSKSENPIYCGR